MPGAVAKTPLRLALQPRAAELYDYVTSRYPAWEDSRALSVLSGEEAAKMRRSADW